MTMIEDPHNHAGKAIRAARLALGRQYTYRKVEALTEDLESQDSQRYEKVSKSVLWEIESYGEAYLGRRAVSPGKLRSIVEIIFKGDYKRFQLETGLRIALLDLEDVDAGEVHVGPAELPLYLEMERPDTASWDRFAPPLAPGADFLVEVRLTRMQPILHPGMVVHCARTERVQPGEIAALVTRREGLVFAGALGQGMFRYESTGETFALGEHDQVYGSVTWIRPMISR